MPRQLDIRHCWRKARASRRAKVAQRIAQIQPPGGYVGNLHQRWRDQLRRNPHPESRKSRSGRSLTGERRAALNAAARAEALSAEVKGSARSGRTTAALRRALEQR